MSSSTLCPSLPSAALGDSAHRPSGPDQLEARPRRRLGRPVPGQLHRVHPRHPARRAADLSRRRAAAARNRRARGRGRGHHLLAAASAGGSARSRPGRTRRRCVVSSRFRSISRRCGPSATAAASARSSGEPARSTSGRRSGRGSAASTAPEPPEGGGVSDLRIRPGEEADVATVAEIVERAYEGYVEEVGGRPAPMDADYSEAVRARTLFVAEDGSGIAGLIVLALDGGHLEIENVAVDPGGRGRESAAPCSPSPRRRPGPRGVGELRLFTHVVMLRNQRIYTRSATPRSSAAATTASNGSSTPSAFRGRPESIPGGGIVPGDGEPDPEPRLHGQQGRSAAAPRPARRPGPRGHRDGRGGPLLHRRPDPDRRRAGGARPGRAGPARRPRPPLHARQGRLGPRRPARSGSRS